MGNLPWAIFFILNQCVAGVRLFVVSSFPAEIYRSK